jgi:bacterioferritin-associated ferredoxin
VLQLQISLNCTKRRGLFVYVCLCNAISDKHVRACAGQGRCSVSDVYRARGCQAQCGKCAGSIRAILNEMAPQPAGAYLEGAAAKPSE